jgi:hypothetical protein
MALKKYILQPTHNEGSFTRIYGPWENFHSYCWHKVKDEHYPGQSLIGLPRTRLDPVVDNELAQYGGERNDNEIYFKTEEDLAFFLLRWS